MHCASVCDNETAFPLWNCMDANTTKMCACVRARDSVFMCVCMCLCTCMRACMYVWIQCRCIHYIYIHNIKAGPNLNTAAEDEGVVPNPVSGSAAPEGRRMERNGIHLRKKAVFATWNIRDANTAKLQVITNKLTRLNTKILGIAEHWILGQGGFNMQVGNVMQERRVDPEEKL